MFDVVFFSALTGFIVFAITFVRRDAIRKEIEEDLQGQLISAKSKFREEKEEAEKLYKDLDDQLDKVKGTLKRTREELSMRVARTDGAKAVEAIYSFVKEGKIVYSIKEAGEHVYSSTFLDSLEEAKKHFRTHFPYRIVTWTEKKVKDAVSKTKRKN